MGSRGWIRAFCGALGCTVDGRGCRAEGRRADRSHWIRGFGLGVAVGTFSLAANAAKLPLWEVGLGGGLLSLPDYRGSDRSQVYPYPFVLPYLRGKVLQADERGIRGLFFESERIKLDVSLDGSMPVSSRDNPAREGMADLSPSFQLGPRLRFLLWSDASGDERALSFNLPLRAAFAIDSGLKHIGYTAHPNLSLRLGVPIGGRDWHLNLTGGPMWGSERYHRYFYSVSAAETAPGRPAYGASAGYSGIRLMSTFYHREPKWLVSFYAMYDSVQGAEFADSPLVKQDDGVTAGFLFTWFFFKSAETIETRGWDW